MLVQRRPSHAGAGALRDKRPVSFAHPSELHPGQLRGMPVCSLFFSVWSNFYSRLSDASAPADGAATARRRRHCTAHLCSPTLGQIHGTPPSRRRTSLPSVRGKQRARDIETTDTCANFRSLSVVRLKHTAVDTNAKARTFLIFLFSLIILVSVLVAPTTGYVRHVCENNFALGYNPPPPPPTRLGLAHGGRGRARKVATTVQHFCV